MAFHCAGREVTFGELGRRVAGAARALGESGVERGDRVALAVPNGARFFAVFYGALARGATAAPLFPASGAARVAELAARAGSRVVVVPKARCEEVEERSPLPALAAEEVTTAAEAAGLEVMAEADDVALIQHTSGSTGEPKRVLITHRQLLTNVDQMIRGFGCTGDDVFVSWLPVHHDMGLILMTMVPFALPAPLYLLPSDLSGIRDWLPAIARWRGTFTAAPDFAYRLALRLLRDSDQPDISSLRLALDAAEPVRTSTVERFEERFDLDRVVVAGYGLAEATVGVTAGRPGEALTVDDRGFAGVGAGFPGVELAIAGDGGRAAAGEVGEILVKSPALARGYDADPAATTATFGADGWLRTGDLGYLAADGELFVVGRAKEIIVQGGLTLAPREIEEWVDALPFVRRSAAVPVDRGRLEGEQAYVFAEVPARHGKVLAEQHRAVLGRCKETLGVRPGRIYLVAPRTLPLTANGKVRRRELLRRYLDGDLERDGALLFPRY